MGSTPSDSHVAMGDVPTDLSQELQRPLRENSSIEAIKDVVFGSVAGMAGKVIEYPFDTVKVRLQSQPDTGPPMYKGPLDCFKQSLRAGGLYSLYRGIGAPMFGAAVETSSLFFSYRVAREILQNTFYGSTAQLPLSALLLCGSASGAFTSLLLTPVELVKCQMQVPGLKHAIGGRKAPGPFRIIADIFRRDGVLGFWRGQLGTLIRETGGSAAWFGAYESATLLFKNRARKEHHADIDSQSIQLPVYQQMLAGAAAGVSYNFTFYPADTIKSRLQTEDPSSSVEKVRRRTFMSVGKALYRERGIRGLYQGCGITCARSAPSSAFIFTVYEALVYYVG